MKNSLGLDESGNWWVIKDGFSKMVDRSRAWPGGESVFFNVMVMAARAAGGDSDVVMRLPALAMIFIALFCLYRLGTKLAGPLAAILSCLIFVVLPDVIYVASTLRPYALALALVTASMLALITWLESGRARDGAIYALLAALTVYATLFYMGMFAIHAALAYSRIRAGRSRVRPTSLLLCWTASALLLIPRAFDAVRFYTERGAHSYLQPPNAQQILAGVVPLVPAGAILLGFLVTLLLGRPVSLSIGPGPDMWWLALWAVAPPVILAFLSLFAGVQLFAPRYYLMNAPAHALLAGMLLRQFEPASVRRFLASTVAVSAILIYGIGEGFSRNLHDFRGAVGYLRTITSDDTPVLVVPAFFESSRLDNIQNPALSEVLLAPFLRYGIPGRITMLPSLFDLGSPTYVEEVFATKLRDHSRFLLVETTGPEAYMAWLAGRGAAFGFRLRSSVTQGGLRVTSFEKDSQGQ